MLKLVATKLLKKKGFKDLNFIKKGNALFY